MDAPAVKNWNSKKDVVGGCIPRRSPSFVGGGVVSSLCGFSGGSMIVYCCAKEEIGQIMRSKRPAWNSVSLIRLGVDEDVLRSGIYQMHASPIMSPLVYGRNFN